MGIHPQYRALSERAATSRQLQQSNESDLTYAATTRAQKTAWPNATDMLHRLARQAQRIALEPDSEREVCSVALITPLPLVYPWLVCRQGKEAFEADTYPNPRRAAGGSRSGEVIPNHPIFRLRDPRNRRRHQRPVLSGCFPALERFIVCQMRSFVIGWILETACFSGATTILAFPMAFRGGLLQEKPSLTMGFLCCFMCRPTP